MGYVYLIHDENNNTHKIGVTRNNNDRRIKKLQTGNSTLLSVKYLVESKYPFRLETMLHNHFKDKQVLNEWYNLTEEEVMGFENLCERFNNIINQLSDNPFFNKNGLK